MKLIIEVKEIPKEVMDEFGMIVGDFANKNFDFIKSVKVEYGEPDEQSKRISDAWREFLGKQMPRKPPYTITTPLITWKKLGYPTYYQQYKNLKYKTSKIATRL